ncbi:MAG: TPM domain-containing protein [Candidatus Egerieousia sp.]
MLFRHRLISREDEWKIVASIKEAELNTSGEIRVHIESVCEEADPIARAVYLFNELGMYRTKARNGVLIYVALKSHLFAIIGDTGIDAVIPKGFWNEIKVSLAEDFRNGEVADGIRKAVLATGELLKKEFPYREDDVNEQSDEISFGK